MKRIVVGTDLAERSLRAVEEAATLAELTGGTLHLVSACAGPVTAGGEMGGVSVVVDQRDYTAAIQTELDSIAARFRRRSVEVETHLSLGAPADALCKIADAVDADLVVVGNRRVQGTGRVLGSVAKRVMQHASCNVMVVHTG